MKISAEWSDDCQGKKDYDGEILAISTRYWPRGGGFLTFSRAEGWKDNDARPEIKPSAKSTLMLRYRESNGDEQTLALGEQEFEADTLEEIKPLVEAWAQETFERAVAALRREFPGVGDGKP